MNTTLALAAVVAARTNLAAYLAARSAAESDLAARIENVDMTLPEQTRTGYAAAAASVDLAHKIEPVVRARTMAVLVQADQDKHTALNAIRDKMRAAGRDAGSYVRPIFSANLQTVNAGADWEVLDRNLGFAAHDLERLQADFEAA